jgi:hypothetical protein
MPSASLPNLMQFTVRAIFVTQFNSKQYDNAC